MGLIGSKWVWNLRSSGFYRFPEFINSTGNFLRIFKSIESLCVANLSILFVLVFNRFRFVKGWNIILCFILALNGCFKKVIIFMNIMIFSASHVPIKSLILLLFLFKKYWVRVLFLLFAFIHFKVSEWSINFVFPILWIIFKIKVIEVVFSGIILCFLTYFTHLFVLKRIIHLFNLLFRLTLFKQVDFLFNFFSTLFLLLTFLALLFFPFFLFFTIGNGLDLIFVRLMYRIIPTTSCTSFTIFIKFVSTTIKILFFYLL